MWMGPLHRERERLVLSSRPQNISAIILAFSFRLHPIQKELLHTFNNIIQIVFWALYILLPVLIANILDIGYLSHLSISFFCIFFTSVSFFVARFDCFNFSRKSVFLIPSIAISYRIEFKCSLIPELEHWFKCRNCMVSFHCCYCHIFLVMFAVIFLLAGIFTILPSLRRVDLQCSTCKYTHSGISFYDIPNINAAT